MEIELVKVKGNDYCSLLIKGTEFIADSEKKRVILNISFAELEEAIGEYNKRDRNHIKTGTLSVFGKKGVFSEFGKTQSTYWKRISSKEFYKMR